MESPPADVEASTDGADAPLSAHPLALALSVDDVDRSLAFRAA
jgi:hypothetical protein